METVCCRELIGKSNWVVEGGGGAEEGGGGIFFTSTYQFSSVQASHQSATAFNIELVDFWGQTKSLVSMQFSSLPVIHEGLINGKLNL